MTNATRFAFTKVFVTDLDAQASFYKSVFELSEKARIVGRVGADAVEEVLLTTGRGDDSTLGLWCYRDRPAPAPGEATLGFDVRDAHETIRRVEHAGGAVVESVKGIPEHGVLVGFVADPEGHLIEVVQTL
ncbi:VOC family protein [Rhodococcus hoagii]|nr:VOC family protein [Prescottella equi]MBM4650714.1 VOC family protein [Prescottella equi]MBM4686925.1 VOC family protein [Prescottella equi]